MISAADSFYNVTVDALQKAFGTMLTSNDWICDLGHHLVIFDRAIRRVVIIVEKQPELTIGENCLQVLKPLLEETRTAFVTSLPVSCAPCCVEVFDNFESVHRLPGGVPLPCLLAQPPEQALHFWKTTMPPSRARRRNESSGFTRVQRRHFNTVAPPRTCHSLFQSPFPSLCYAGNTCPCNVE
jgi:hypothetical protein